MNTSLASAKLAPVDASLVSQSAVVGLEGTMPL